jgi:Flp pilus assembly protein TadB
MIAPVTERLSAATGLSALDMLTLAVFALVCAAGGAVALAVPWLRRRRRTGMRARLNAVVPALPRRPKAAPARHPGDHDEAAKLRLFRRAEREEAQLPLLQRARLRVARRLTRAGGRPAAVRLLLWTSAPGAAAAAFAVAALKAGPVAASALGALAGAVSGVLALRRMEGAYARRFLDNLPDAIDLIVRAVKAGIPVSEAVAAAGRDTGEPVRSEFARIAEECAIGIDLEDAMVAAARRVDQPDFRFLVVSLALQRETGGRLAETLDNLAGIIRKRREMRLKIRAMTAEGRMSAKIVAAIPLVAVGALWVMSPEYIVPLVETPGGRVILMAAIATLGVGLVVINRMVSLKP